MLTPGGLNPFDPRRALAQPAQRSPMFPCNLAPGAALARGQRTGNGLPDVQETGETWRGAAAAPVAGGCSCTSRREGNPVGHQQRVRPEPGQQPFEQGAFPDRRDRVEFGAQQSQSAALGQGDHAARRPGSRTRPRCPCYAEGRTQSHRPRPGADSTNTPSIDGVPSGRALWPNNNFSGLSPRRPRAKEIALSVGTVYPPQPPRATAGR
jgi:hypothetical protein